MENVLNDLETLAYKNVIHEWLLVCEGTDATSALTKSLWCVAPSN